MYASTLHGSSENASTNNQTARPGISLAILVAGILLVGFSHGRWLAPLAAWMGPVLIMRYARDHKGWRSYLVILAATAVAILIGFGQIWVYWGVQFIPIFAIGYGLLWSLPYLADRLMGARITGFTSTLVYPLAATTLEFVNIHTNPIGVWGATGFTQYGVLPIMQLASVTGMIGITFLMGWFASVANWTWENRSRRVEILRGLVIFGAVFAAVYIFGFLRLTLAPISGTSETVRVAGIIAESNDEFNERIAEVVPDPTESDRETLRQLAESHRELYFAETIREAQAGAKVIVWDEMAGLGYVSDEVAFYARAQEVARQNEIYLALPVGAVPDDSDSGELLQNKLLIIDPTGEIVMEHIKYGGYIFEGYRVQGNKILQSVDTPFGVISGVVCWDMDYPGVVQQAGLNGTGLMLVPSRDWLEIDPIHTYMAVFRAVENGMSVVRQADKNLSIAVDPYGRVLAQTDFFGSTDRTLVAQVPTRHVPTLYTAFGRWLEWLAPIGLVFLIARTLIIRQKQAQHSDS